MKKLIICIVLILAAVNEKAMCIQVFDPVYKVEPYISYFQPAGLSRGMTFDSEGNLYVTYSYSGTIDLITPSKTVTQLASGLNDPRGIVWTGGTSYGENLYVACHSSSQIKKVSLNGSVSTFWDSGDVQGMELDRFGNYGGYLYAGTRSNDHVEKVFTNGQSQRFSDFPYEMPGGPTDIAFDPGTDYGGLMYVTTDSSINVNWLGIYSLDIKGNPTRFAPTIAEAHEAEFDSIGMFGKELFIVGQDSMSSPQNIWRIDSMGGATKFAGAASSSFPYFAFGPDGAMYVQEYSDNIVTISRIIPEPATLLLLGLGALWNLKKIPRTKVPEIL